MNAENGARGPNEEPQPAADNQVALPMVPQPAGKADDNLLRKIFPEEIWIKILKEMNASCDLKNVSKASPYFGKLLQGRRTEYLFPEVLNVLVPQTKTDGIAGNDQDYRVPLRPLRAVCKNWRDAVDASPFSYTSDAVRVHTVFSGRVWNGILAALAQVDRGDTTGFQRFSAEDSPYLRELCIKWL